MVMVLKTSTLDKQEMTNSSYKWKKNPNTLCNVIQIFFDNDIFNMCFLKFLKYLFPTSMSFAKCLFRMSFL